MRSKAILVYMLFFAFADQILAADVTGKEQRYFLPQMKILSTLVADLIHDMDLSDPKKVLAFLVNAKSQLTKVDTGLRVGAWDDVHKAVSASCEPYAALFACDFSISKSVDSMALKEAMIFLGYLINKAMSTPINNSTKYNIIDADSSCRVSAYKAWKSVLKDFKFVIKDTCSDEELEAFQSIEELAMRIYLQVEYLSEEAFIFAAPWFVHIMPKYFILQLSCHRYLLIQLSDWRSESAVYMLLTAYKLEDTQEALPREIIYIIVYLRSQLL